MCIAKRPRIPKPVTPQEAKAPEIASFFDENEGRTRGLSQGQGFTGGIGGLDNNLLGSRGARKLGE